MATTRADVDRAWYLLAGMLAVGVVGGAVVGGVTRMNRLTREITELRQALQEHEARHRAPPSTWGIPPLPTWAGDPIPCGDPAVTPSPELPR